MSKIVALCFYLIFLIVVNLFVWNLPSENSTELKDCYDKYGSRIIGESCEHIELGYPVGSKIFGSIFALFVGLIFFKMEDLL